MSPLDTLNRSGLAMLAEMQEQPLDISLLAAYWRDPAPFEAEREAGQAELDALFAAHEARWKAEQQARWAREEGL